MSERTQKGNGNKLANTLTSAQVYRLTSWLDAKREFLTKEKKSRKDAAEMAAKELDFPITENNVAHCCRTLELKLYSGERRSRGKNAARLAQVEKDIQTVMSMMKDLETSNSKNLTTFAAALANLSHRVKTIENKLNIQAPSHLLNAVPTKAM